MDRPLINWLPLALGVQAASLCTMVLVRRQWVDQERLIYPVMQVNLAMVQPDDRGRAIGPFFRSGAMWLGFSVPVIVGTIIGLHAYFPYLPTISMGFAIPYMPGRLSFATIGFFFLLQREVAFGLWVFSVLNIVQANFYSMIGWGTEKEAAISVWSYGNHSLVHQSMGGMIVLVLGGLWVGREHLWGAARKAFSGATDVDDGEEILSYRGAVFGLLLSAAVVLVGLLRLGIPLPGVIAFMFFGFVVFMALTRVVAEGGVAVIYPPLVAPAAAVSALGSSVFGMRGMVGMAFTRALANDLLNFTMPHIANGLKLSGLIRGSRRGLFWGMLLAILLGVGGWIWVFMYLSHKYGVLNLSSAGFMGLPEYIYGYALARGSELSGPNWFGWLHTGIGGATMVLLLLARRFWAWWPLHPIGFPISSTLNWMAFNALIAWTIKTPILRYGGVRAYRRVRPFFLGMILGQFVIYAVFWIIDSITGMQGNALFL